MNSEIIGTLIATVIGTAILVVPTLGAWINSVLKARIAEQNRKMEEQIELTKKAISVSQGNQELLNKNTAMTEEIRATTNGASQEALKRELERGYIAGQIKARMERSKTDEDELSQLEAAFNPKKENGK